MQVYNKITLRNQALNASFNGPAMQLENMFGYAIQIEWTGTINGTFKLQASTDDNEVANHQGTWPLHWTDIPDSDAAITTGDCAFYNVTDVMYNWVRIVFTDASSGSATGVITSATFNGKGA